MKMLHNNLGLVLSFGLILLLLNVATQVSSDSYNEEIGLTACELARLRKFNAEEHLVITPDGYVLSLCRILNPKINNGTRGLSDKRPVLFIHGETATGAYYLIDSLDVEPKDLTAKYNVSKASIEDLIEALKNEPLSGSLPLLVSAFGNEAWVFDRRATPQSRGHVSPDMQPFKGPNKLDAKPVGQDTRVRVNCCASGSADEANDECPDPVGDLTLILKDYEDEVVNTKYWNITLDTHALIDLPAVLDYILAYTRQLKLDIVGHSTGSAITMMMLSRLPERARQVERVLNFAPSLYQANSTAPLKLKQYAVRQALAAYTGPLSIFHSSPQVRCLLEQACFQQFPRAMCTTDQSPAQGQVGNNLLAEPAYNDQTGKPVASKQTVQTLQNKDKGAMYLYDYGNPQQNRIHYGTSEAPKYDVRNMRHNGVVMSLYHGPADSTAPPSDVERLIRDLGYRPTEHYFNQSGIFFNHQGPIYHEFLRSLVTIPALKEIQTRV